MTSLAISGEAEKAARCPFDNSLPIPHTGLRRIGRIKLDLKTETETFERTSPDDADDYVMCDLPGCPLWHIAIHRSTWNRRCRQKGARRY